MIQQVKFNYYINSIIARFTRAILFLSILSLFFFEIYNQVFPKSSLFFLSFFLIAEVFLKFKISSFSPQIALSQNDGKDLYKSCSKAVLQGFILQQKTSTIIRDILHKKVIIFILEKTNITPSEITLLEVSKNDLLQHAAELSKKMNGLCVTSMDVIVAYLLLTEAHTKILFAKKLKEEDLLRILYWARIIFLDTQLHKPFQVEFTGEGIGESLVSGWTLETKKYTRDITAISLQKRLLLIGRENEYKMLEEALSKKENNNVLLIGESGTGKDNLVEDLAQKAFIGKAIPYLNHKKIYEVMVGALISGTENRGELESRLQAIIQEVAHARNVILYIPQFENIIGGSSFAIDISGALLPYLQNGNIPIIASMTPGSYKTFFEKSSLHEVLTTIQVNEPDRETAIRMLFDKAFDIEKKYHILISYKSVVASVDLANRYVQDSFLPGNAVTLLSDTVESVSVKASSALFNKKKIVLEDDVILKIEEKTKVAIGAPSGQEKDLLLHLGEKIHERVIGQDEGVKAIVEAIQRIRTGLTATNKPISFLFLGPTGVGKTETAKSLAFYYFGGEQNILRFDMSEYATEQGVKRLLGALPGEGEERGELTEKIHDHPFSVVLLDEFEKAHPKILDLFLQALDDGRLTDNKGRTVLFVDTIVIATSNAGSEFIREEIQKGTPVDKEFQKKLLSYLQSNNIFRPELLNRFDEVITFKPFGESEILQVTKLLLQTLVKKLQEKDITISFDDVVIQKIAKESFSDQFGARPIKRYIQDNVEGKIAEKMLKDEIKRGNKVLVTVDNNSLSFAIS